ncbi:hypothetical protein F5Y11DRAFT_311304 [Daldinia sp. FL1419]|nr:hypothetical protein F5Y11DRAFT_311304 [Daldinia sp. FL1419]
MRVLLNMLGFNDERIDCFLQNGSITHPSEVTASDSSPPSTPGYNNIDPNIAGTLAQARLEAPATNFNEQLQIRDVAILEQNATGLTSPGYQGYLSSQILPSQTQDDILRYTRNMSQLPHNSLVLYNQHSTSVNPRQHAILYDQLFRTDHIADSYSDLSHSSEPAGVFIAQDTLSPASPYSRPQKQLSYTSTQYGESKTDSADCLPLTLNTYSHPYARRLYC